MSNAFAPLASGSKGNPVEPGIFESYKALGSTVPFWRVHSNILHFLLENKSKIIFCLNI